MFTEGQEDARIPEHGGANLRTMISMSSGADIDITRDPRRVVFVAGAGRSGTSTFSSILRHLELRVPAPEVPPDETNPRGFAEPQWVVDFHDALLRRAMVGVADARPQAWVDTQAASLSDQARIRLDEWLTHELSLGEDLLIKDPRLSWFLEMWRDAVLRCGAIPAYTVMLRPPAEVIGSREKYYGGRLGNVDGAAGWLNMLLHTEKATRGSRRTFVQYHDLLDDPIVAVRSAGAALDLSAAQNLGGEVRQQIQHFVDPALRRVRLTWDDVRVPAPLRELAEVTWSSLVKLSEPQGDTPEARHGLDQLRQAYVELYEDAEAIAQSSARAAARRAKMRARQQPVKLVTAALPRGLSDAMPYGLRKAIGRALSKPRSY